MATIAKGNPYTHYEETRESVPNHEGKLECAWCGQTPYTLYRYNWSRKPFCNRDCWRDGMS